MVSSLNVKLSGEQIRSVIRTIDLDGGGFIDFPEFEAAVKRHEDVSRAVQTSRKCTLPQAAAILGHHETREDVQQYAARCSGT